MMRTIKLFAAAILVILCLAFEVAEFNIMRRRLWLEDRGLSINLGGGNCKWTSAFPLGSDAEVFGTILAGYPASGMRMTWQHAEGLTGIQVGDDFNYVPPDALQRTGIIKTQYPHLEGIWSWGDKFDQVILLVRNPRHALPSYHTLLSEIHYAADWETVAKYYRDVFKNKPTVDAWIKWRDLLFDEELLLWSKFIDYWMTGGMQYWIDLDFERNLQWPFEIVKENERKQDVHCIYEMNCYPVTVLSFDRLFDPTTGPVEATKMAKALEGKKGMTVIEEEAIPCVWNKTMDQDNPLLARNDFDRIGTQDSEYVFTLGQLKEMRTEVSKMRIKYSSGAWANNKNAQDIVSYFDEYIVDITNEVTKKEINFVPTPAPNEDYKTELYAWYVGIGRAGRYPREKMQAMAGMWEKVKHLYDE